MSSILYGDENYKLLYENGKLIYASNPSLCICCGDESESLDGQCCVFVTGLAHCIQSSSTDTVGEWLCTQCHPGSTPTSSTGDPTNDGRNVWYSSGYGYDMSSGDWYVEQRACPIWYNASTGTTYWPPIPIAPTISTTTAANAVLTSYTATHDCTTSDDGGGCYDATDCTSITIRFEGTSTPPTCTNCPACSGYTSGDSWSFQGYSTPFSGSTGEEPRCNGNPYRPEGFTFGIRSDCNPSPTSYKLVGEACDSCP